MGGAEGYEGEGYVTPARWSVGAACLPISYPRARGLVPSFLDGVLRWEPISFHPRFQ